MKRGEKDKTKREKERQEKQRDKKDGNKDSRGEKKKRKDMEKRRKRRTSEGKMREGWKGTRKNNRKIIKLSTKKENVKRMKGSLTQKEWRQKVKDRKGEGVN